MRSFASTIGSNLPGRAPLTPVNRLGCCHANTHTHTHLTPEQWVQFAVLRRPTALWQPFPPLALCCPFHCSYTFQHCSYFSHFMTRISHTPQKTVWGSVNASTGSSLRRCEEYSINGFIVGYFLCFTTLCFNTLIL